MPITIIHCWSAPRSRSTALLYSFEARGEDTVALDEPLYRRWLQEKIGTTSSNNYGISRPYAEPFLKGVAPDDSDDDDAWRWEREKQCFNERIYHAVESLMDGGKGEGCLFNKQMAKFAHLFDFETNWEKDLTNNEEEATQWKDKCMKLLSDNDIEIRHRHLLLIRDPISCLGSWMGKSGTVHANNIHPDEVGITQLLDVYSNVLGAAMKCDKNDDAVVIDSDELAANPRKAMEQLCIALGIDFREGMLQWERGMHKCDGPWAKWWYHDVWESSGWDVEDGHNNPRTQKYRIIPPILIPSLRMSIPGYNFLQTLTTSHKQRAITKPPSGKLYEDPRNEHVLVFVGRPQTQGRILPREMAAISPFDSSVQGGDATWGKSCLFV